MRIFGVGIQPFTAPRSVSVLRGSASLRGLRVKNTLREELPESGDLGATSRRVPGLVYRSTLITSTRRAMATISAANSCG
jgi:hypothetical protein